jgi:hypothetical protein
LLVQQRQWIVRVFDHPMSRAVFTANPFVAGFTPNRTISLDAIQTGDGHIVQRLMQGLNLPLQAAPGAEVYLTPSERAWAQRVRRRWPRRKPICILSSGGISDRGNLECVQWDALALCLSRHYTVVQPAITESVVAGAIPCRNLSVRQYLSLFSVADLFVGGTSGGSHAAAAFGVPAVVVIWEALREKLRFPIVGPVTASDLDWKAAYLYPHHWFVTSEEINSPAACEPAVERLLAEVRRHGASGRPLSLVNNARHPYGFVPRPPVRIAKTGDARLIRMPVTYDAGNAPAGLAGTSDIDSCP